MDKSLYPEIFMGNNIYKIEGCPLPYLIAAGYLGSAKLLKGISQEPVIGAVSKPVEPQPGVQCCRFVTG